MIGEMLQMSHENCMSVVPGGAGRGTIPPAVEEPEAEEEEEDSGGFDEEDPPTPPLSAPSSPVSPEGCRHFA